ncbi:MAG: alpha-ketoglutarate-dependent dioxygenase AlkB [Arenibacterium sp.]
MTDQISLRGVQIWKSYLNEDSQVALVGILREIASVAPFYTPVTRQGRAMSVRMTAAGRFGWFSDRKGYRYIDRHPDGCAWPVIPERILALWADVTGLDRAPECCLINYYGEGAKMGLHQDRDEANFDWPVVSLSLGDDGLFRVGSETRGGKTESIWLQSGDVAVMGGAARLVHHGVDRIRFGSSRLLPKGGRINLTLRVVT